MTAAARLLSAALLWLTVAVTETHSELIFTGCVSSYIRLTCSLGDSIRIRSVTVVTLPYNSVEQGPCAAGGQNRPDIPTGLDHLCLNPSKCVYDEGVCNGKSDCLFYVGTSFLNNKYGAIRKNSAVTFVYECTAGFERIGGLIGICLVTAGLIIIMTAAATIIYRKMSEYTEDESKYVEFENRISRSGSMSSEISAKIKDRNANKDVEKGAEGGVEEATPTSGVKSSTSF